MYNAHYNTERELDEIVFFFPMTYIYARERLVFRLSQIERDISA